MTVLSGCLATDITVSTPATIDVKVWDAEAYYPLTGAAFTEFTDTVSEAAGNPALCPKTYSATIDDAGTVTTFELDIATKTFKI